MSELRCENALEAATGNVDYAYDLLTDLQEVLT